MSQRTRAHTTDAATRSPRKASTRAASTPTAPATVAPMPQGTSEAPHTTSTTTTPSMDGETLVRTLRAVAAELERDPALAKRVARAAAAALPDVAALAESATAASAPERPAAHKRRASTATPPTQPTATPERAPEPEDAHMLRRPARTFRPRLITGTAPDVGPGVPDPFALHAKRGEAGLRAVLDELRLGTLRAMVREYSLDPSGQLVRQNDADKLRSAILDACASRV